MRSIILGSRLVTDYSDCYVIAEIGHNHQGDLDVAKKMFSVAKSCGADAVKLQKRNNRELFTEEGYNAPYSNENSYGATYGEHRDYLEFGVYDYLELKSYAKEIGIDFFATAFDFSSADFLHELDVPFFKVASGDLTNIPLLKHIARFGKPMIISTGGASIADVYRAYESVRLINDQICLMQCTACYPADFNHLNLRVIETYRRDFPDVVVGLSAHDNGIAMAPVAYVLGARVIEKHFTLNRASKGTDHAFSLEPSGLRKMVRDLQRTRIALGDGIKRVYPGEVEPIRKMSKKIVAARDLPQGWILRQEDVCFKSPGDGARPYEIGRFIGYSLTKGVKKDEAITDDAVLSSLG